MNERSIARTIGVLLFGSVLAGQWDVWWHVRIGRDTFWEPPHMFLYGAIICSILLGVYGWRAFKDSRWRNLAAILLIVPLSAPFDNWWHAIYGVENITDAAVVWSPPHVALITSVALSIILLVPILRKDKEGYPFLATILMGALANLTLFLAIPLQPTGGFGLIGFWGAGASALIIFAVLAWSRRNIPGFAPTVMVAFVVLMFMSFTYSLEPGNEVRINDHGDMPSFLIIFSMLIPAALIDAGKRIPLPARVGMAGMLYAGILYLVASHFFQTAFKYPVSDALIAIAAAGVGATLAALLAGKLDLSPRNT